MVSRVELQDTQEMLEFLYRLTQSNTDALLVNRCDEEEEERAGTTAQCACVRACGLAGQSGRSPSSWLGVDETLSVSSGQTWLL